MRGLLLPVLDPVPPKTSQLLRDISRDPSPPVSNSEDVRDYVQKFHGIQSEKLTLKKDEKAAEFAHMTAAFSENSRRALFKRRCGTALANRKDKLNATASERDELCQTMATARKRLDSSGQERWNAMERRHAADVARLESERPHPGLTPGFRKRTGELVQLMQRKRKLDFQGRFDEAREFRGEIERREAQEAEVQQQLAEEHWQRRMRQLRERHAKEQMAMREWIASRQRDYDRDRDGQVEAVDRRAKLLTQEIREIRNYAQSKHPHAIRRHCQFERSPSRGLIETTPENEERGKLFDALPERARSELLRL
jgi:hypothetical protein